MGAVLRQIKEVTMAQIGSFTRGDDGILSGTIRTLSLNVKARFVPAEASSNEKAPALRVLAGSVEIGAAWKRTSKDDSVYHSVKLDDPSFPARSSPTSSRSRPAMRWSGRADPPAGASRSARRRRPWPPELCGARTRRAARKSSS